MEMAKTLAYYDTATITAIKCFIVQAPEVNLINHFWCRSTYSFSKFDLFIALQQILFHL
jgi:hypothetical protein